MKKKIYTLINQRLVVDELVDPCVLELEDMWCCREVYARVLPDFSLIPQVSNDT